MMSSPNVVFCGYAMPHPTENKVNIHLQTSGMSTVPLYVYIDVSALRVLDAALAELELGCDHILQKFKSSII